MRGTVSKMIMIIIVGIIIATTSMHVMMSLMLMMMMWIMATLTTDDAESPMISTRAIIESKLHTTQSVHRCGQRVLCISILRLTSNQWRLKSC